jgi:hypothetical protein
MFYLSEEFIQKLSNDIELSEKQKDEANAQLAELEVQLEAYRQQQTQFEEAWNEKLNENQQLMSDMNEINDLHKEKELLVTSMEAKLNELAAENDNLNELCQHNSLEQVNLKIRVEVLVAENEELSKSKSFFFDRFL